MTHQDSGTRITPVILSGGSGSRLWPMSRSAYPKQFLTLTSELTMIQETALRVAGDRFSPPVVVCNEEHRFIVAEQLRANACRPADIILEPVARNTAPAAAVAALRLVAEDEDATMLIMPADHVVRDTDAFLEAVEMATKAAAQGAMVALGVTPDRAETGYGYICVGDAFDGGGPVRTVERFVEKPDQATAERYLAEGGYLWNSGVFVFRAKSYLEELAAANPDMAASCRRAYVASERDLTFIRLDASAFSASPADSIDYAVMEKTANAAVVPVEMGWSDVGAWSALWEIEQKDPSGNVIVGDVILQDTRNAYVHSQHPLVAVCGVENLVVVATDDAVLVADRTKDQDVKALVDHLNAKGRTEQKLHSTVHRPWGRYRGVDRGDRFQVKRIIVEPGQRLSLQMHHHRAEHWIVVEGTACVTRGKESFLLYENQSTFIPSGAVHRLENPGKVPLHLIEVQSGGYLEEDDIVRFEDGYGRLPKQRTEEPSPMEAAE